MANTLRLGRKRPESADAARYRISRNEQALHRAAAQLWTSGVPMRQALNIVSAAIRDVS